LTISARTTAMRIGVAILTLSLVAACASRPKPVEPTKPAPVVTGPTLPPPAPPPPAPPANPPAPPVIAQPLPPIYGGPTPGSAEEFRVAAGDRVYFATDSHDLSAEARSILERQAQWLGQYRAVNIMIAGNADERGTREYNLALGARRAQAAKDFLVSRGVAAGRIQTVSYGKERPIDGRSSDEGWSVNRNAGTTITTGAIG
jgi:peptidoglycan-associated lipoprotein